MATVNANDLRIKNAYNFIETLNDDDGKARSYMFVSKPTPWENENEPPVPVNNYREFNDTYNEMISLKRITDLDAYHMIPKVKWISGTVFDMYRHNYSETNTSHSNASNLIDSVYYTLSSNNYVYVCLDNNNNTQSLVEPQNTGNVPFYTSDGYQWLKLYQLRPYDMIAHGTENYIPVLYQNHTRTPDGGVFTVRILSPGNDFTNNPTGLLTEIYEYYCNIVGDGRGAVAKVIIRGNIVSEVKVVRAGYGYTYAEIDFKNGRVYRSLPDLDKGVNGLNPKGDGRFVSEVIISPPGGWGSDLPRQLGSYRVGVFSDLRYDTLDFVSGLQFRRIGIIQDPKIVPYLPEGVDTLSAHFAIKVESISGPEDFDIGDKIQQIVYDEKFNEHTARATVIGWDREQSVIRYIQYPQTDADENGVMWRFSGGNQIMSESTDKIVEPSTDYSAVTTSTRFYNGYADPEIIPYSGLMTYLSNLPPVYRAPNQTERVSLLIAF